MNRWNDSEENGQFKFNTEEVSLRSFVLILEPEMNWFHHHVTPRLTDCPLQFGLLLSVRTQQADGWIHTSVLQQISRHRDNSATLPMCTRSPPSQAGQQPHLLSGWLSEHCYFSAALNAPLNHYAGSETGEAEGLIAVFAQRRVSRLNRSSADFQAKEGTANEIKR